MVGQVLCTVSERDSLSLSALTTPNISSLAPSLACVSLQLLALLLPDPYLPSMAAFNALALPGSRFCVERRKGVCLPVWRRLKMIGFWPLWPLDALH